MSKPDDHYTIMILGGVTTPTRCITIPKRQVRLGIVLAATFLLVHVALMTQCAMHIHDTKELASLQLAAVAHQQTAHALTSTIEDLKQRVQAIKTVNQRLRLMLGAADLKPEDVLNGQGGDDALIDPEQPSDSPAKTDVFAPASLDEDHASWTAHEPDSLLTKAQRTIDWLMNEIEHQEHSLSKLHEVATTRTTQWASTPSIWPVKGWITSGFGPRLSPFTGQLAKHNGLDIGAPPNTEIHAPADGLVTATGFDPRMGNIVNLDHGNGMNTQYGHLASILVKTGQKVTRGDRLGLVGSTGLSTGPHLHYMIKVNGQPVDPSNYILD